MGTALVVGTNFIYNHETVPVIFILRESSDKKRRKNYHEED
jgi:predicted aspartyl protease